MKKITTAIISIMIVFALCFTAVGCSFNTSNVEENTSEVNDNQYQVYSICLNSDAPMTVSGDVLTATLTATVLPESLADKSVDWSVEWMNPLAEFESTHNVTDYVTVTPDSDGSLNATVTALQPFENTPVLVRVTTRSGGFSTTAKVAYVGVPSSMNFVNEAYGKDASGNYIVGQNSTATFDIELSNIFGASTDTYYNTLANIDLLNVVYEGSAVVSKYKWNNGEWVLVSDTYNLSFSELAKSSVYDVEYTINATNIEITTGNAVEILNNTTVSIDGSTYKYTYKSTTVPFVARFNFVDRTSGITNCLLVAVSTEAQSVSVDNTELYF